MKVINEIRILVLGFQCHVRAVLMFNTSDLCPPSMMTLTGERHVRTCNDQCPRGSSCIQGICCIHPVSCNHFAYRYPSPYSCLPRVKKNCPDDHKCVPSSREGMYMCCKARPSHSPPVPPEKSVCPASHPVISNNRQQLRLCSDCQKGVCAPFRTSNVSICCHSFTTFCGPGSTVEMDGLLARDCSRIPCSVGYGTFLRTTTSRFECSLAPFGNRVCCSLADCPSGERARAVCAAGCRKDETCVVIHDQRWCCPKVKKECPNNRLRLILFTSDANKSHPDFYPRSVFCLSDKVWKQNSAINF
uniref:CC domain-containing protein n=1 Tax=Angiostrongylus cantonensis TaxID=6313 RepID=A0A158P7U7_ANGCA